METAKRAEISYVASFVTAFNNIEEAYANAPEAIAAHISRSKELHKTGSLISAGAFLNEPGEPLSTMAVFNSREDAEAYAKGDPFVEMGLVTFWRIREWANILA